MTRIGLCVMCIELSVIAALNAQRATFVGVVTDSLSGAPLPGANVFVENQTVAAITGDDGLFRLVGVHPGEVLIAIRMPGYKPGSLELEVNIIRPTVVELGTIPLSPLVLELEPVVVEETRVNNKLERVGFFRRKNAEQGTFLTHDEIEKRDPRNTSELLRRIPAIRAPIDGIGNSAYNARGTRTMMLGATACPVSYYIDGVHAHGFDIDNVPLNSIAAIEVYSGSATMPPRFRLFSDDPKCGVVVIWTRIGGTQPSDSAE